MNPRYEHDLEAFKATPYSNRGQVRFIPIGHKLYNSLGYMLGPNAWPDPEQKEFHQWAESNGVKYDGAVYEFPDEETLLMAKVMWT
jgi:hypothetical protein